MKREYSRHILECAEEFKISPAAVESADMVLDFLDRFSFVKNINELGSLCFEIRNGKSYTYEDIPEATKRFVSGYLKQGKSVGSFTCQVRREKNLKKFIKLVLDRGLKLNAFLQKGVLTYKNLKNANAKDNTSYEVEYVG